jgi:hypothetical protein
MHVSTPPQLNPELSHNSDSAGTGRDVRFAALAFTLLPLLYSLCYLAARPSARTYGPSHWFLNYQYGFVRRGLIGQAFGYTSFLSLRAIHIIELIVFLGIAAFTYVVFRRTLFGSLADRRFAAFLLVAPAALPHLAYLSGEVDNFLYIMVLLAAVGLMRFRNLFGLSLATLWVIIGMLMHEAFALMFYPLILAILGDLLHHRRIKPIWAALHLGIVFSAFVAIVRFGKLPGTIAEWLARAQNRTDMRVEGAVFVALHNTFSEQLKFVSHLYHVTLIGSVALTLLISVPYGIVLWRLLGSVMRFRGYKLLHRRALIALFCAPLLLSVMGHDVMRWASGHCINVSLFVLFLYQETDKDPTEADTGLRNSLAAWTSTYSYTGTLFYLIAFGPWGIAGNRLLSNLAEIFKK